MSWVCLIWSSSTDKNSPEAPGSCTPQLSSSGSSKGLRNGSEVHFRGSTYRNVRDCLCWSWIWWQRDISHHKSRLLPMGGNNNQIFRIIYRLLILRLFASFSHRCVAPAVIFSNGRSNGHAFACFTVLFAYAHIHTEVTCIDLNTVCQKHDQRTQTERKDHTSKHRLTHKNTLSSIYQGDRLLTHHWERPIEHGPLLPSSRGLLWLTVRDGGHIFSSKVQAVLLAPVMNLILLFSQSMLVKTKLM